MQKVKSNASWNELTPEQLKTLDQWLFEEKLGFREILPKAEAELGYVGSVSSLVRYHERRQQQRLTTDFKETVIDAVEIEKLGVEPDVSRKVSMQVAATHLFRMLRSAPDEVKKWAPVASLLVQNDHNEAWREIKGEEQKIRREALEFTKEKFQVDMVEQALMALPELLELARARRDPEPKAYKENVLLNRIRRKMFGVVWEVRPETVEEEAAMAARRVREGKQPEAEHLQTKIAGPAEPVPGSAHYEEYLEWRRKHENGGLRMENGGDKAPSTKIQAPEKLQNSNSNGNGRQAARCEEEIIQEEGDIEHPASNVEHPRVEKAPT